MESQNREKVMTLSELDGIIFTVALVFTDKIKKSAAVLDQWRLITQSRLILSRPTVMW